MKCLVSGNHGYIGYILTNKLIKFGYDVVGYDADYFPLECFGREDAFLTSTDVRQINKDIRDINKGDLKGIDAVFHLAALPNDPACNLRPELADDINRKGAVRVAVAARKAGVKRFIYASTCSVYGSQGETKVNEKTKPNPITPYGLSKYEGECEILQMTTRDFTAVSMRNATCYGVSPRMRFDMVLNSLVGYAYTTNKITVLSDGTAWRPLIHIEDVATSYLLALEAPEEVVSGQVFISGVQTMRINMLADEVRAVLPQYEVIHAPGGKKDLRSFNVDSSKIMRALKFKPEWDVRKGTREVYNACMDARLNAEKFKDKKFWADKYFNYLVDNNKVDSSLRLRRR